ncbi:hypothetical protein [Cryobacterium adonitolivorans]|uniref:hypothetical protein n=1 Tax=Cryobacterium adonitolivorans TaxID=1259189 RepID=UPI00141B2C68|nr:hypothetical protein [Cryobacterium adonitolivorans]
MPRVFARLPLGAAAGVTIGSAGLNAGAATRAIVVFTVIGVVLIGKGIGSF